MKQLMDFPVLVLIFSFLAMLFATMVGDTLRNRVRALPESERQDFVLVLGATLTLLGLIIGFSFSMAVSRYDQRKNLEEAEANAISTEYVRSDFLPAKEGVGIRDLLRKYIDQRVLFYKAHSGQRLAKLNADTVALQTQLWAAVSSGVAEDKSAVSALTISGMNDVFSSQDSTQAAWLNRIPIAAWGLMFAIAIFCNLLIGYGAHRTEPGIFMIAPAALSIAFFLISEIDSPVGGTIQVAAQNLERLSHTLR